MKRFSLIAAMAKSNRGIGWQGTLPWKGTEEGKADINYFSHVTQNSTVIMGRKTWDSLPKKFRPLPSRNNIIVSKTLCDFDRYHNAGLFDNCARENYAQSLHSALDKCKGTDTKIFVIGGQSLYNEAIGMKECEKIYLTEIDDTSAPLMCDTFFPTVPSYFRLTHSLTHSSTLKFQTYTNQMDFTSQECSYLSLLNEILLHGDSRSDRTGKGIRIEIYSAKWRMALACSLFPNGNQ